MSGVAGSGDPREPVNDACREGGNKDCPSHPPGGDPLAVQGFVRLVPSNATYFGHPRKSPAAKVPNGAWRRHVIVKRRLTASSWSDTRRESPASRNCLVSAASRFFSVLR